MFVKSQGVASGEMPKEGKPFQPDNIKMIRQWLIEGHPAQQSEPDEWGHETVAGHCSATDFHATVMHRFGMDHPRLVYKHNVIAPP